MSNDPISLPWLITDEPAGPAASAPSESASGKAGDASAKAAPSDQVSEPVASEPAPSDQAPEPAGVKPATLEPAAEPADGASVAEVAGEHAARPGKPGGDADAAASEAAGAEPGPGLRTSLEAILLVADEPVPEIVLAQVVERPTEEVVAALRDLAGAYTAEERGFDLREIAGGWRFYTRAECAGVVERFVRDGQEVRLTQASLETLAVVAYRQPVSRARVSAVRGVNCDGVMRTLVLRGLVAESGTDPDTGAVLFQTTGYFLERLGLASLADLPELAPFLPDHLDDEQDAGHENTGS